MRVVLEVTSDPHRGRRIWLRPGQSIKVGRTHHASFVLDNDPTMASVHFSLTCDVAGCRLQDLESERGTWVNGEPVSDVLLRDADQIKAGDTIMTVHVEGNGQAAVQDDGGAQTTEAAPQAAPAVDRTFLHSVGGWHFQAMPEGWSAKSKAGLQQRVGTRVGSCRVCEQDRAQGLALETFVEKVVASAAAAEAEVLRQSPVDIPGAEQAFETAVRFSQSANHSFVQTQVFAVSEKKLGLATFITAGEDRDTAQIDEIIAGLVFE